MREWLISKDKLYDFADLHNHACAEWAESLLHTLDKEEMQAVQKHPGLRGLAHAMKIVQQQEEDSDSDSESDTEMTASSPQLMDFRALLHSLSNYIVLLEHLVAR